MAIYYQVYEYYTSDDGEEKRLIHTFEKWEDASGLVDYLYKTDSLHSCFDVEEYEATT